MKEDGDGNVLARERDKIEMFAHVQRMDNGCIRQRMTKMELQAGGKEEGEGWCDTHKKILGLINRLSRGQKDGSQ